MFAYPLAWFATAIVIGALCAAPLPTGEHVTVYVALAAFALALIRAAPPHLRVAAALALVAATCYAQWRIHLEPAIGESRTARFSGTIVEARTGTGGFSEYRMVLDRGLTVSFSAHAGILDGERVVVRGRLEPFDGPRNPGEPSQAQIERDAGVDAHIASARILARSGPSETRDGQWARLKAWALEELRMRLGDPAADIVAGELWGERGALPPDLRAEFQETGTVHVLVTAGLHVGLVAALVLFLCGKLGVHRAAACIAALACVWIFAAASGLHVPALRAATMASSALLARACGRRAISWTSLSAAAIAVVLIQPDDVASASFWLSFCCVASIFALATTLDRALENAVPSRRLREAIVLTVATQLGTWPITAAVFLQFTPYAIVANVAVVPCVPVTMALGAAQLAFAWYAPLAQACANLNGWIVEWMTGAVRTLSALPGAAIVMTPAPTWALALYEGALLVCAPLVERGGATLAATLLISAASLILSPPRMESHTLRVTVLDVGQADAIEIQTPAGHGILVDAGGRLERGVQGSESEAEQVGERIVAPFLIRQGIHALDAVIVSHPHGDHVGGCAPVLRKIRVAEIADSGQTYGGHAYHDCLDTAGMQHVPVVHPRAGDVWRTSDGVTLTFIGPSLPLIGGKNAINDNSIAFILHYRQFRMLFTGDAGVAAERRFLNEGIDLHADVLKVGHHGSAYSSSPEFLAAIHPRYAIISVGRHNLFGHPAPSTIATLEDSGAKAYRTDEDGATVVLSDGLRESLTPSLETQISRQSSQNDDALTSDAK